MVNKDKNINNPELTKITNFKDSLNRLMGSASNGKKNGYLIITELIAYVGTLSEQVIERPTPQPVIDTGVLTIDLNLKKQGLFEPRKSEGTLSIDENFTWAFDNETNGDLISVVLSLTGTRIITFPADVLVSNASTLGTWASPNLTITAGTDDLIEFQFLRYKTNSKWLLKVGEVAV